ncbi:PAS and ANTAR domain-containing protein [Luteimicrobium sp. NPDC057192]|uniref:PAS and ANTAR domain-containing protein n=1 Tax=Luteimicrobium sp. NPDC057192 TaxID=3346042 RepID=UPI00363D7AD7
MKHTPASKRDDAGSAHEGDPTGRFRYEIDDDRWWWSEGTYRIHGFEPGEVVPTTALLLAHKHPDDRDRVEAMLTRSRRTGEPFGSMHRIMDATGATRHVVLSGQGMEFRGGRPHVLAGGFTDVTCRVTAIAEVIASEQILASDLTRAAIEQAKGILCMALGAGPEEAFDVLREESMRTNVPLRDLARRVVANAREGGSQDAVALLELS